MVAAQFYFIECLLLFNFMILFQLAEKDKEYCEGLYRYDNITQLLLLIYVLCEECAMENNE